MRQENAAVYLLEIIDPVIHILPFDGDMHLIVI